MKRLTNSIILLVILLLINVSCRNAFRKDLSLTVTEYQKLGMPSPDKIWTTKEYVNANITMSTLKIEYPLQLPRKNSKKSGALYRRFVSNENLSFANDTTLPLSLRAFQIQFFPAYAAEFMQLYNVKSKDQVYYKEEILDINLFALSISEKMLELSAKIMQSKDDADIELQSGLSSVKSNYLRTITMLLGEQLKAESYSGEDQAKLSDEILRSLTSNHEWILPTDRDSLSEQIRNIIKKSSSEYIRKNYTSMLKILTQTN
jgi:hypothetical protein